MNKSRINPFSRQKESGLYTYRIPIESEMVNFSGNNFKTKLQKFKTQGNNSLLLNKNKMSFKKSQALVQDQLQQLNQNPRFKIKRKYLSFNPQNYKRAETSLQTQPASTFRNSSLIISKQEEKNEKNDLSGTYFIPKNIPPYSQKYRDLIFKKKGKKKHKMNPQLTISQKQTPKKQFEYKAKKIYYQPPQCSNPKKQNCKSDSYFRPWSGFIDDIQ